MIPYRKTKTISITKRCGRLWIRALPKNKPYNYYPRGRVEIRNGNAVIYANPGIATEELRSWAVSEFNLTEKNGIKKIIIKADGSDHYKSYIES